MRLFQYHPDIVQRFPQVVGGAILARDVSNGPAPADFVARSHQKQQHALQRIGVTPLSHWRPGDAPFAPSGWTRPSIGAPLKRCCAV